MISQRQGEILNRIVREYIERALPVSSQLLEKKYKFGLSSATIRNEMQELTDEGYLLQPHISAGRVPTDKGYRFFVDELLENNLRDFEKDFRKQMADSFEFVKEATRFLAEESSELALGYLADQKIIWKEGWQEIFEEPEFSEPGFAANFARMINDFEGNIEEMFLPDTPHQNKFGTGQVKIYIGKENPVSKAKDFSIITSGFEGGFFAILGPKRMSYDKNIELFHKLWEKI